MKDSSFDLDGEISFEEDYGTQDKNSTPSSNILEDMDHKSNNSSEEDELINKLMEGDGLPEDIIIELMNDTHSKHLDEGIDDSFNGMRKSEKKIDELLDDVSVPTDIKVATTTNDNILVIKNYNQFLLLQSRLTGVPLDTLLNGLQVFEDGGTTLKEREEDIPAEQTSFEFEEELEELPTDEEEPLDEGVDYEEYDNYSLDNDENDDDESDLDWTVEGSHNIDEDLENIEDDDFEIEDEEIPELDVNSVDVDDIEIVEEVITDEDIIDDADTDAIDGNELDDIDMDITEDNDSEDGYGDELFEVAKIDPNQLNLGNKVKVNNSKTYALHELEVGGSYEI